MFSVVWLSLCIEFQSSFLFYRWQYLHPVHHPTLLLHPGLGPAQLLKAELYVGNTNCKLSMSLNNDTLPVVNSFLPDVWRQAYITPVFKKGDATQVCNYRPISFTCTLCKRMESVIKDQFVSEDLINKHQHGYISKHSTITNLL